MNNITDYKAVSADDIQVLNQKVTDLIDAGWQPFGSLCYGNNEYEYVQPMVKYKTLFESHIGHPLHNGATAR